MFPKNNFIKISQILKQKHSYGNLILHFKLVKLDTDWTLMGFLGTRLIPINPINLSNDEFAKLDLHVCGNTELWNIFRAMLFSFVQNRSKSIANQKYPCHSSLIFMYKKRLKNLLKLSNKKIFDSEWRFDSSRSRVTCITPTRVETQSKQVENYEGVVFHYAVFD